jgi:site-specific DNA-adenine methylase
MQDSSTKMNTDIIDAYQIIKENSIDYNNEKDVVAFKNKNSIVAENNALIQQQNKQLNILGLNG